MNSIRNRLLLWLLCGLGALLVAGSAGVYFTTRDSLFSEVDIKIRAMSRNLTTMAFKATQIQATGFGPRPNSDATRLAEEGFAKRWPEVAQPESGLYYQVWSTAGKTLFRSSSLEDERLPRPEDLTAEERYSTMLLAGGREVRTVVSRPSPPRGRNRPRPGPGPRRRPTGPGNEAVNIEVMVAHDLSEVNQTLSTLLGRIILTDLAMAAATALLVVFSVRRGLSPLREFSEELATIDATSLDSRFDSESLPRELAPITNRLNDLMGRLENSFERERRFSSDLAHELRTPIAELRAIAELSEQWPEELTPEKNREVLEISLQMQRVVENLLALTRWEQSSGQWKPEDITVADIVDECWKPYAGQAAEKDLDVTVSVAPEETLTTDPGLLRHILSNLFSNAVEYTPPSGSVNIETHSNESGNVVGMSVANSVHDLDSDDVSHLFERFWRRDESRTDTGHAGLGLSLAKACADVLSLDLSVKLENEFLRFDLTTAQSG